MLSNTTTRGRRSQSSWSRTDLHFSFTSSQLTFNSCISCILIFVSHNLFSKSSTIFKTSASCLVILRSCFAWAILLHCQPMTTGGAAPFVRISKLSENGAEIQTQWMQSTDRRLRPYLYLVSNTEHKGALTRNVSVSRNNLLPQSEEWQKKIPMSQATYVLFWLRVTSDERPLFIVYSTYTVCSIQPQTCNKSNLK